jgi:hypothetical protein
VFLDEVGDDVGGSVHGKGQAVVIDRFSYIFGLVEKQLSTGVDLNPGDSDVVLIDRSTADDYQLLIFVLPLPL